MSTPYDEAVPMGTPYNEAVPMSTPYDEAVSIIHIYFHCDKHLSLSPRTMPVNQEPCKLQYSQHSHLGCLSNTQLVPSYKDFCFLRPTSSWTTLSLGIPSIHGTVFLFKSISISL